MNGGLKEFLICKGTELAKELPKHDQEMIQIGWEASRISTLKEMGEWLEGKMFAVPLGGVEWHIRLDEVEAFKHGEMPGNRED